AKIGGNDVFWEFSDRMFDNQRRLGDAFSIETAVSLGINEQEFRTCLDNSREIEAKLAADRDEAIALGGRGTPFAVVITPTENLIPFSGALSYEQIMSVVERARSN
ncbi:MAG: DsbA family protein, partial [Candidatus Spechtbacterales bacterium]